MDQVERAQDRVAQLQMLLEQVRHDRDRVRLLDHPASAVGAPGIWTGTAANRLHRDELAPLAMQLRTGLERAEQSVLDELRHATRELQAAAGSAGSTW